MNWMTTGIIIIFAAFIILMILNPKLSCFGKQITSPLYPLKRKRKERQRRIKTDDYGFHLDDAGGKGTGPKRKKADEDPFLEQFEHKKKKARDYGFHLGGESDKQEEDKKTGQRETKEK